MLTRNVLALTLALAAVPGWAQNAEEAGLIATLQSGATVAEKDAACHRLKEIGTAPCVPALAACLPDDALSHPARQALESIKSGDVIPALVAALQTTAGLNRVGVIDSLGLLRKHDTTPVLIPFLSDPDTATSEAAARSLGRLGRPEAVDPLMAALRGGNAAAFNALLECAQRLRERGEENRALELASALCAMELPEPAMVAAHRMRMLTDSFNTVDHVIAAITGTDPAARKAALGLAAELPGSHATMALAGALEKTEPAVQISLLRVLGDRGDGAARDAVERAVGSHVEPAVRVAAINALADLGDATSLITLVKYAAYSEERDAAREALTLLRGEDVCTEMARMLLIAPEAEQVELARALAARREPQAVPALVQVAAGSSEPTAVASLKAVGVLANETQASEVIALLLAAQLTSVRDAAEDALVRMAGRSDNPGAVVDALVAAQSVNASQAVSLLTASARIDFVRALPALQRAIDGGDPNVRSGAVRVLAQYAGLESKDQILQLANAAADETERTLLLRGYWRVLDLAKNQPAEARLDLVKAGMAAAKSEESRKSGVAALAAIPLKAALDCALQARSDDAVKAEAELATFSIASALFFAEHQAASEALAGLAESATDETLRGKAAGLSASLKEHSDYVVPWLVSKPYRQEGKEAQALFDVQLGPEIPGGSAEWQMQPGPADLANFWQVDLGSVVGGDHCVVYLKTQVFSENGGPAVLEIGSDDGFKLWVNSELVKANNAVRGFAPAQDRADVTLKPGWNTLTAKVTQHTAGCALAVRIPGHVFQVEAK